MKIFIVNLLEKDKGPSNRGTLEGTSRTLSFIDSCGLICTVRATLKDYLNLLGSVKRKKREEIDIQQTSYLSPVAI
jgi:hypothetical protein